MDGPTSKTTQPSGPEVASQFRRAWLAGLSIFALALFGILTRPIDYLAVLWPANAVLLGLMVRDRRWAVQSVWFAATIGYLAADLITGSALGKALWLTGSNLAGVVAGFFVFSLMDEPTARIERHRSVLYLFCAAMVAALVGTITGCLAGPLMFNIEIYTAFRMWFCAELVNYLLILPVMLSAPRRPYLKAPMWERRKSSIPLLHFMPLLGLAVAVVASIWIGGTGAFAIPFPALLWCALTYSTFYTAVLSMLLCFWQMYATANGVFFDHSFTFTPDHVAEVFSSRVGAALLMLGPLAVAVSNTARKKALEELEYSVQHDQLTNVLARGAFLSLAQTALTKLARKGSSAAVLMIDLDHFKQVNDVYGHAAGDDVLKGYAQATMRGLRTDDLFGRLGGEEFAILLPEVTVEDALAISNRLREALSLLRFTHAGETFYITASMGLVYSEPSNSGRTLEQLLLAADKALYEAKSAGRDQVVFGTA